MGWYQDKLIKKVKSDKKCDHCKTDLKGDSAVSVYDGYESSFYFCNSCYEKLTKKYDTLEDYFDEYDE